MVIPCVDCVCLPHLAVWSCVWCGLGVSSHSMLGLLWLDVEIKWAWAREFVGFSLQNPLAEQLKVNWVQTEEWGVPGLSAQMSS